MTDKKIPDCCKSVKKKENTGFWGGLMYGLLPHTGCIAFVLFTVLGVTTAASVFKPLLMNAYFFYILIAMSFIFATISAFLYLKKHNLLSLEGIKRKKSYLSIMYGTTILVNLLFFFVIFPWAANAAPSNQITGDTVLDNKITLQVAIPCPGHASLITEELYKVGVSSVKFRFPNLFDVTYNPSKTSEQQILGLDIFNTYRATIK